MIKKIEDNNILISVIIPCYNVENYVEKAIESVINQTYKNIEIIVIDDCSTDNTYDVLCKLKEKHNGRFVLYKNEKNGGLAYTRNFGVKKSTGEYVGFIDSDDYIDNNYYEKLVEKMISEDADLVVNDIQLVDEEGRFISDVTKACEGEITKVNLINNGLVASACNKLLRKDLIIEYPFLEGKINEDVASIIPVLVKSKKIAYAEGIVYYYVQRTGSIQNSTFSEKRFDMFDSIDVCLDRIKGCEDYEELKTIILFQQLLLLYIFVIVEIKGFCLRYRIIKKFIKLQEKHKIYQNDLFFGFYKSQRKALKRYYYILVKLMKFRASMLINVIIMFKQIFMNTRRRTSGMRNRIKRFFKRFTGKIVIPKKLGMSDLISAAKKQKNMEENQVKVSVIVPNYNYEKFMYERVFSILNQTVKVHEIIMLDDCSKDNSIELIDKIVDELKEYVDIYTVYNEENSGSAFKQWAKGFKLAKGDYVWIAEADDYCDSKMLENLIRPIQTNDNVRISYVDTSFVNGEGEIFLKTIKPEIDLMKTGHWDSDFVTNGIEEIKNYMFLNCTIANVSSCIIKKDDYKEVYEKIGNYRQAGDWLFYANVIAKGDIAFINKPMNFYRVHGENITSQMKKQKHLEEIKSIHNELTNTFGTNEYQIEKRKERYEFLTKVWHLDEEGDED